ncbi:MAG: phosphomethylpyrimidine synthase ThiC [Planctomycetota bacterium]
MTQLVAARDGQITPAIERVAADENIEAEVLRDEIARGRVVIPANVHHDNLEPVGIGHGLRTKVNANIGTSPSRCSADEEGAKLQAALEAGADAVMDLSIGGDVDEMRKNVVEDCPRPVGTVPVYQNVLEQGSPAEISAESYLDVLDRHARDGVDFVTVHAGIIRDAIPLLEERKMGVVSRGGSFMIKWMKEHGRESFLYEHYEAILDITSEHDVTLSLGDGLRPGCLDDATDEAQMHELKVLGELAERARERGVQVMIEGPGHVPLQDIAENVRLEREACGEAPFYVLGPLPTDSVPGYDHVAGAIGGAIAASEGADFLCYLTPREHVGLPDRDDVREGVVVARIAAHVADIANGIESALERDRAMSAARTERDWDAMARYALDPRKFQKMRDEKQEQLDQCSMCGEFCALKVYRGETD